VDVASGEDQCRDPTQHMLVSRSSEADLIRRRSPRAADSGSGNGTWFMRVIFYPLLNIEYLLC